MPPEERSWVFCEHANENPSCCPCDEDCVCRKGMCKDRAATPRTHTFNDWPSFRQALQNHVDSHGMQAAFEPLPTIDTTIKCKVCGDYLVFNFIGILSNMLTPVEDSGLSADHHRHTSLLDLFLSARNHVEVQPNHKLRAMDDTHNRLFGFACDCRSTFLITVDDYRKWLSEAGSEARQLIGLFIYRRHYLFGLMNSEGDMLKHLDAMQPMETVESVQTAYQRLMIVEEDD
jgi:hypothetical protein